MTSRFAYPCRMFRLLLLVIGPALLIPVEAFPQGETTSAIVGEARDTSGALLPGAAVTIVSAENGLKRIAKTDDAGRFNFAQLKPGVYTVRMEAAGFTAQ